MSDEKIIVNVDIDLEDLIPGFLQNRSKELESLRDALERQDFQSIQSVGHSLKGVGGGYGFDGMSDLGAKIENSAKAQELDELTDIIKQYENYLERIEVVFE
ncbi:MAG: Hpt domain-containing protein [Gammaproteobacteria bacterium]|nr:Hpt domain-containing protein [Gammaproteobacteria bacterium]